MSTNTFNSLKRKIERKQITVGIVGLGYVGLPLSLLFSKRNIKVIGFDIDLNKIKELEEGRSYINHIEDKLIHDSLNGSFLPSSNFSLVSGCDIVIICVPTPLNKNREPDLSFINNTLEILDPYLKQGQLISLESTTYPGTTEEIIGEFLKVRGFKVGENIFLSYSPEREDPGNTKFSTSNIPKIVSGYSSSCLELAALLYSLISDTIHKVSTTKAAEMTKLLENIYRSVNIGLVNEMKILAIEMDIDIFEIIEAASTKPFGFHAHFPGPGVGGHCIPIDPFYLTWKAREYGMNTKFIELAGEINQEMPKFVFSRLIKALNMRRKAIKGSKINLIGLSYKKNVDDQRESPSVILMDMIEKNGGIVSYSDPYIPEFKKMRAYNFDKKSQAINKENLKSYDAAILCTDHDIFDYKLIIDNSDILIDTRGVYAKKEFSKKDYTNLFTA